MGDLLDFSEKVSTIWKWPQLMLLSENLRNYHRDPIPLLINPCHHRVFVSHNKR